MAPPSTPTGGSATTVQGAVTISWTAVAGADSYNVYRDGTQIATGVIGTSYEDDSVADGTTYSYTVTAVNAGGASAAAAGISVTTPPGPPGALNLTANASSTTGTTASATAGLASGGVAPITYSWSATGPASVAFSPNNSTSATTTTMTFTQSGSYDITVTATDANGDTSSNGYTLIVQQAATSITMMPAAITVAAGTSIMPGFPVTGAAPGSSAPGWSTSSA